ncbi:MAG: hypothetical protein NZM40_05660 [Sphingomonadaceae bacterium]|uniref:hypothetical protein n=1 Tax=Thermaurantiacus sp. TaxID=2820283 RepID=UPI00298EE06C|nr:hypothetical protein [Thermaurantiacus sp.]MCS6986904.1 hypothetical protein [Sphingomonadaceae bacterium]MDW8415496.1 hypothetical protein [Thermaurantiacus sp.]
MFRSLRPRPLPPLPRPFPDRRAERAAARRRQLERFFELELAQVEGASWNARPEPWHRRFKAALPRQLGALLFASAMGSVLVASFLILARSGLAEPPPRIVYVEDWSGRIEPGRPIPRAAPEPRGSGDPLARERAAARAASPGP